MAIGPNLEELKVLFGIYVDDKSVDRFPDATRNTLINVAQRHIQDVIDNADQDYFIDCRRYDVTPQNDALEFELPDDFKRAIIAERETSERPVEARWVEFRYRHNHQEQSLPNVFHPVAQPVCYLRTMKLGVVHPTDTYTLTLWYIRAIPELTNNSDFSEIPAEHRNLIPMHAAILAQGSDEDGLPQEFREEYQAALARLITFVNARQKQEPRKMHYVGD